MADCSKEKIGIVGSGLVGRAWCTLFISQGHPVCLYDIKDEQLTQALNSIKTTLLNYENDGYLKGNLSAEKQFQLISVTRDLQECVKDAFYIQESVFENVDLKRDVMSQLDDVISDVTIVASSSSALPSSAFTEKCKHRANMLVAHPVNPPYLLPLVEVVPAPWTCDQAVKTTMNLLSSIGQSPVLLKKEVAGFLVNRIQYAIMNECWNLVNEGVVSVEDIDKVMTDGLGPRYAFSGPLETIRLNARGIEDYFQRYGEGIRKVNKTYSPHPQYTEEEVRNIESTMAKTVSIEELDACKKSRDIKIAKLSILKRDLKK